MDFTKEMKARTQRINDLLLSYLPEEKGLQKTVIKALNYSMEAGGKRIRPMLMEETWKLFGGEGAQVEPFMAAIEMIHTYSLVHDDLPAMDNDEYRRGRKSTHAAFGEAVGILAGDALLNLAFETMANAIERECSPRSARAMRVIAEKAGIFGMIGGQMADVEAEGKTISLETLDFIQEKKTAALIEASMMAGAVLAGADETNIRRMEQVGSYVGKAFQIQDDILDVTSTTEVLGKPVGSDEKNQKSTYVTLLGMEKARTQVQELTSSAMENLRLAGPENPFLMELILSLMQRKY